MNISLAKCTCQWARTPPAGDFAHQPTVLSLWSCAKVCLLSFYHLSRTWCPQNGDPQRLVFASKIVQSFVHGNMEVKNDPLPIFNAFYSFRSLVVEISTMLKIVLFLQQFVHRCKHQKATWLVNVTFEQSFRSVDFCADFSIIRLLHNFIFLLYHICSGHEHAKVWQLDEWNLVNMQVTINMVQ